MKSKVLAGVIILVISITGTVFADIDTHNKMNPDLMNMDDMQKHMKKMQRIIEKIQNTKDEKEKQKLMSQIGRAHV